MNVQVIGVWFKYAMPISALQVITGRSVLVFLTFAAGSDVSVVINHEIEFVCGIFNRHWWSHESIICSWFWVSKKVHV